MKQLNNDNLLTHAKKALEDKERREFELGTRPMSDKERDFLYEYFKTGRSGSSYSKIFGTQNKGVASVLANRLIKSFGFKYEEILAMHGHSMQDVFQVLNKLKTENPSDYIKYMIKFLGVEKAQTQINIQNNTIQPPTINIVNNEQLLYSNNNPETLPIQE